MHRGRSVGLRPSHLKVATTASSRVAGGFTVRTLLNWQLFGVGIAEQGACDIDEALEVLGFAVVAAYESEVAGGPEQARLHDPAVSTQSG